MTLLGSVAQFHHPLAAVAQVIPVLLHCLRRQSGKPRVRAFLQRVEKVHAECVEEKLPGNRISEVPDRELGETHVPERDGVPKVGKIVGSSSRALGFSGELKSARRLTDEVEGDVRQSDVLLQNRPVPAPLGKAMTEYEPVVADAQQIFGESCLLVLRRNQNPLSPRGTL